MDFAARIAKLSPELEALYIDLHENPELSLEEARTAARMADGLRRVGLEVTTGVGGHGVVGVLRNGDGPTVLLRTDIDALPIEEATGLPFASRARSAAVPVMHACGHDLHMASWMGAVTVLAAERACWRGTLVAIAQPAEERFLGARAMLADGLYTRFPRPDVAIAIHDHDDLPSGKIGFTKGHYAAAADFIDITLFGKGGHGAYPHTTVDPIVLASRVVLALQTIVARECNPIEPAVVSVGAIHGGAKHNVIPDEVHLALSVRTFNANARAKILAAIHRIVAAEALAANAPREPLVTVTDGTKSCFNDPALTDVVATALANVLGPANVVELPPEMGSEDFGELVTEGVRGVYLSVGAQDPTAHARAQAENRTLPGIHSSKFAPDYRRAIPIAVLTEVTAAITLFETLSKSK